MKIMEQLIIELKEKIIKNLNLKDLTIEDIDTEAPLFVEGLGLDSIDALDLIVILEKDYGIKIESIDEGKNILNSVKSMAEKIMSHNSEN